MQPKRAAWLFRFAVRHITFFQFSNAADRLVPRVVLHQLPRAFRNVSRCLEFGDFWKANAADKAN